MGGQFSGEAGKKRVRVGLAQLSWVSPSTHSSFVLSPIEHPCPGGASSYPAPTQFFPHPIPSHLSLTVSSGGGLLVLPVFQKRKEVRGDRRAVLSALWRLPGHHPPSPNCCSKANCGLLLESCWGGMGFKGQGAVPARPTGLEGRSTCHCSYSNHFSPAAWSIMGNPFWGGPGRGAAVNPNPG